MRVARGAESDPRLQLTEMTRQLSTMVVKVHSSDERAREMEARMSQALAASERLDNETQAMRFTMAGAQTREQEAKDKIDEMEGQLGSMMEGVDKWKREASVFRRESQARELAVKREQQLRVEAELERDKVARQVQGLKDLLVSAREDCERVKAEMEAQRLAHEKELLRMSQEKASTFSNITGSLAARRSRSRKGRTPNGERGASPALDDEKANLARSLRDFWAVGEEEEAAAATNEPPRSPSTGSRLGSGAGQSDAGVGDGRTGKYTRLNWLQRHGDLLRLLAQQFAAQDQPPGAGFRGGRSHLGNRRSTKLFEAAAAGAHPLVQKPHRSSADRSRSHRSPNCARGVLDHY